MRRRVVRKSRWWQGRTHVGGTSRRFPGRITPADSSVSRHSLFCSPSIAKNTSGAFTLSTSVFMSLLIRKKQRRNSAASITETCCKYFLDNLCGCCWSLEMFRLFPETHCACPWEGRDQKTLQTIKNDCELHKIGLRITRIGLKGIENGY